MTEADPAQRSAPASRRAGYGVAVVVNAAVLYAVNRWPGWSSLDFLTASTEQVLGIVNASIVASLVANLIYAVADPPRLKAFGDIVTTGIGLAAAVRIWQVFPFDFGDASFDWELLVRILIVVAIAASVIAIIAAATRLVRVRTSARPGPGKGTGR
jgi:hypothetical protein